MRTVLDLESTDLGPGTYPVFSGWIETAISGRCVALWLADKLESCIRLRFAKGEYGGDTTTDAMSGFDPGIVDSAACLFDEYFDCLPGVLIQRALDTFCGNEQISIDKINSVFRRLSLETRWSLSPSLRTLHVYFEVLRADLFLKSSSDLPRPRAVLSDADLINRPSFASVSLIELNVAMDEYLLRMLKLKSVVVSLDTTSSYCPYLVLGLEPGASLNEVKKAYKRLAMHAHPDKGGSKELFQAINEAYEQITRTPAVIADEKIDSENDESSTLIASIVKASETCVRSAEQLVQNATLVATAKECGLACLQAAAFGYKMTTSSVEFIALAEETMNAGFDLLNTVNEGGNGVTQANKCAQKCAQLAKSALGESSYSKREDKPPPVVQDEAEQVNDNWELFTRLNAEILRYQPVPTPGMPKTFLIEILHDHMRDVVNTMSDGSLEYLLNHCHVFVLTRPRNLALSTNVLVRAAQFLIYINPTMVVKSIETVLVPTFCAKFKTDPNGMFHKEIQQILHVKHRRTSVDPGVSTLTRLSIG